MPWLKLSRNTSTPASKSAPIRSGVELDGPSVATILALRRRRKSIILLPVSVENQDRTEIVYVGQCGAGHNEIAESGEESISVISRERLLRRDASRGGTCQTARVDNRSGIVFCSIDSIGVAGERPDALGAIERYGEREQELGIASAAAPAGNRDSGLAARQNHGRGRDEMSADPELSCANLKCDRRVDQCHLTRFPLDPVAENDWYDLPPVGCRGGGLERPLRAADQVGPRAVGPEAMTAGSSPGTSEIASVTMRAGAAAAASLPPLMAERCFLTVLISVIVAPERRSARVTACLSASVIWGAGTESNADPPPDARNTS